MHFFSRTDVKKRKEASKVILIFSHTFLIPTYFFFFNLGLPRLLLNLQGTVAQTPESKIDVMNQIFWNGEIYSTERDITAVTNHRFHIANSRRMLQCTLYIEVKCAKLCPK